MAGPNASSGEPTSDTTQALPHVAPRDDLPQRLSVGDRVAGRFVIVQFLARGGMGEVYEAADEHLQGKHCALKTLRPEVAAHALVRQRFEREVLLAREISHPNVCPTYDIFREETPTGPLLFLTMKLLRGESLAMRLSRLGALGPDAALPIIRQMAAALDAAHKAGVIHRDFKPGNVMIESAGPDPHVSITDFGLSRLYESDATLVETGHLTGTIGYIAPEMFHGRVASPTSDVYSFGVVLHEMITGQRPQTKPGSASIARPSSLVPGLSRNWDRVILGCLEYDPTRRFQSAGEALAAIEQPSSSSRSLTVQRRPSRRTWIAAACAIVLIAALFWFSRAKIYALLHPLPKQRFVALMPWPPGAAAASQPLRANTIDAIGNRLARAEALDKNLLVISPADTGQPAPKALPDVVTSLGANLVLGVTLSNAGESYALALRVIDPATGKQLRTRELSVSAGELSQLAGRAASAAASLLDAAAPPAGVQDQESIALLTPEAFRLFTQAGELYARPNDAGLDEAIEKYQQVLQTAPRFALGYADLGIAYARKFIRTQDRAFLSLASKNSELALRYNPQSARAVLCAATVALYSGDTQAALDGFARALQFDPDNPQILLQKARVFRTLARHREEEDVYREVIRTRPNFWPAYNELGQILFRQTKYREAAEAFGEAAAVAPRVALPLANQGAMYLALGQEKDAEDAFRRSLDRAPNEIAYTNLGAIVFRRGEYRHALELYEKARDLGPRTPQRWRNIADCYAMLGDRKSELENYAKAAELLSDALQINPRPGASWVTLAFYHAKLGRTAEAESDLKAADERHYDQRAQFVKAQALAVMGRKEEALQLVLNCLDQGLSAVDVELALDLKEIRADPRYRRRIAQKADKENQR
jgi:tetratricopeptide (TPR) repeat protein/tRNA A-37 threonylcarbamoyl transferase component Bud32